MSYGITPHGLSTKSFDVLKNELLETWSRSFGEIDDAPDGVFGQLADSLSSTHAEVWQIFQDYYNNMNPNYATGSQLARLLALQGMSPLGATRATVDALCTVSSNPHTLTVGNATIANATTGVAFDLAEDLVIATNTCNRFEFTVSDQLVDKDVVGFTINTQFAVGYVAPVEVTLDITNPQLSTKELVAQTLVTQLWDRAGELDLSEAKLLDDKLTVQATTFSPFRTIGVVNTLNGTIGNIARTGHFVAQTEGLNVTPPNTITNIRNGADGIWIAVDNIISGTSGSNAENDDDLRRRLKTYKQYGSTGSRTAIEAKLWQDVRNISNVRISSNNTSDIDYYGRPPHSMHAIVEGGSNLEIATIIANNLPAGITTHGSVSVDVPVSWQDNPMKVSFDRVRVLYGHILIEVNELNSEEVLQSNAEQLIRESVFQELIKLTALGADIIAQKYVGAVYRATGGLEEVSVKVAVTGTPDIIPTDTPSSGDNAWEYNVATYSSGWQDDKVFVAPSDRVEWRDGFSRIIVKMKGDV